MEGLSDFINERMEEWKVPGLAIAIVHDSQIIFCEGFGFRDVEKGLKVTSKTIFGIGSCTKAFTTMAMGILAERGKLDWDKPVRHYLPTFKLYDAYASEHMTLRDLVTHRSGLPRHDAIWYNSPLTRKEIVERLQYLEPSDELRTVFQYQNLMYMTAGYLVGEIAESSWEEFVQQEIFNPLSMVDSNFSVVKSQETDDFSLPYREKDDVVKAIPFRNIDTIGSAGSINSNVTDMAKWLLLHQNQGNYEDKQIINPGILTQMYTPQIVMPSPLEYPEIWHSSYGLGWIITAYRGHNHVEHGGGIDGFSALTTLMPQDKIAVVVLTNLQGTLLPNIITYHICDRLLGLDEVPWNERIKSKVEEAKQAAEQGKQNTKAQPKTGTQPSHPLEDYTGDFEHPGYGIVSIALKDQQLTATYNNSIVYELKHYHYDSFELLSEILDDNFQLLSFFNDPKGTIQRLSIPLEPTVKDIVFERIPDQSILTTSFMEKFVGEYDFYGHSLIIFIKDNQLVALLAGQPEIELVLYQGTEFNLKDLSGFSINFTTDNGGVVTQAVITQPNGVFTANKKVYT
ncbi:serine hydrolase [Moorena sp. SIOASIH]|uniref:serine hydrolase n=1 Tax=Moorena sp. SIOASIH TaxID=2607817 RepID=UPI0025F78543|nr:serine hydrolase [Moorena sp. SIOASIH]